MTNSLRAYAAFLALACAFTPALRAQDSSPSLGDVVRNRASQPHKKAKRVLSDEDVGGPHKHEVTGWEANTVIIPGIRITGNVPDYVLMKYPPDPNQKMYVSFGPSLDSCFDLDCAHMTFLHLVPGVFGGKPTVLYESDDFINGNSARVLHLEIMHDVRGKVFATVALIQTPASVADAFCTYKAADAPDVETDCEAFIASLQIHVPEKYIYVQHRTY